MAVAMTLVPFIDVTNVDQSAGAGAGAARIFGPVANCHCSMCRKAQGCAFATNASVSTERFRLLQGAEAITEYESSPGKVRCFCRVCGSPIYSRRLDKPSQVRVRFGTLNEDPGVRAELHACVDSKAPWLEIADGLPQLDSAGRPMATGK